MSKSFLSSVLNRLRPRTIVGRISSVFFLLSILLSGLQYLLISRLWFHAERESRQQLEWHLAADLAPKIQADLNRSDPESIQGVKRKLQEFETINPRIEAYILDQSGRVLPDFYRGRWRDEIREKQVPASLLDAQDASQVSHSFPLFGPTLHNMREKKTIFSSAPIRYQGKQAYLYLTLDNYAYNAIVKGLEAKYIFLGGILSSIVLLIALSLIAFLSIQGLARRFKAFSVGVMQIAGGNYTTRVSAKGNDEVAQLGAHINEMASTIEESIEELRLNDLWRKQMTANISHDLKTPIASMLAHNEHLRRSVQSKGSDTTDSGILNRLDIFERNLKTMNRYIEDILELSYLESGQLEIDIVPFHLIEIIEDEIIPKLQPLAEEAGISLQSTIEPDAKLVYFDISLFQRVVENLVLNALKYSEGTEVVIGFQSSDEYGILEIRDNGTGIAEDKIAELRKPFVRGDNSRTSSNPGSGLGLSIVSLILAAHGSALEIQSAEDKGTRMRFTMPKSESAAATMIEKQNVSGSILEKEGKA